MLMEDSSTNSIQSDLNIKLTSEENDISIDSSQKKQEKIQEEREKLIASIRSSIVATTKEKVAYILNRSSEARNSDIDLAWEFWSEFEPSIFKGVSINKEELRSLTDIRTLSRARAKIQNEYNLYLANEEVRKFRGTLKEEIKRESIEDKPEDIGLYSVYLDETGKNDKYIAVGSVWLLDAGSSVFSGQREIEDWCKVRGVNFEFHFSQLNKNRVEVYKEFFTLFLRKFPTIGFKAIAILNQGFKDTRPVITDLTYHVLIKGILHEDETKRAPLPRMLQVWIDEDEKGSDALKLANVRDRLTAQKIDGLHIDYFGAVESTKNFFIQMADLFTGSLNRKLNSESARNHKDEFADFVLENTNFNIDEINKENAVSDNATVFHVR